MGDKTFLWTLRIKIRQEFELGSLITFSVSLTAMLHWHIIEELSSCKYTATPDNRRIQISYLLTETFVFLFCHVPLWFKLFFGQRIAFPFFHLLQICSHSIPTGWRNPVSFTDIKKNWIFVLRSKIDCNLLDKFDLLEEEKLTKYCISISHRGHIWKRNNQPALANLILKDL